MKAERAGVHRDTDEGIETRVQRGLACTPESTDRRAHKYLVVVYIVTAVVHRHRQQLSIDVGQEIELFCWRTK